MKYASYRELEKMRDTIKADKRPCALQVDVSAVAALMACVLDTVADTELSPDDSKQLMDLAAQLANMLEEKRPDVEPYIAFLYGLVAMRLAAG
jgi:hypothetical protein